MKSMKGVYFFLAILCGVWAFHASSAFSLTPEETQLLQQTENRLSGWVTYKAAIQFEFFVADKKMADCQGEVLYRRMDEKLLLQCFDEKKERVFVFKTADMQFQLYLDRAKTLFQGNIFDLEYAPNIDSQLKPLHLYHALKFAYIPRERTEIDTSDQKTKTFRVLAKTPEHTYVSRMFTIDSQGDVPLETYFDLRGNRVVEISRSNFKFSGDVGYLRHEKIFFPEVVTLVDQSAVDKAERKTILHFSNIETEPTLQSTDWISPIPKDAKTVQIAPTPQN